jgi:hypothetical protein
VGRKSTRSFTDTYTGNSRKISLNRSLSRTPQRPFKQEYKRKSADRYYYTIKFSSLLRLSLTRSTEAKRCIAATYRLRTSPQGQAQGHGRTISVFQAPEHALQPGGVCWNLIHYLIRHLIHHLIHRLARAIYDGNLSIMYILLAPVYHYYCPPLGFNTGCLIIRDIRQPRA